MSQRNASFQQPRVDQNAGDEIIAQLTSVIFNPKNLKMYHIIFVIVFILFIWMTEFANVAVIIKSLFIVAMISLMVVESIIIFSYIK